MRERKRGKSAELCGNHDESRTNIRRRTREIGVSTAAHGERARESEVEWVGMDDVQKYITDESFLYIVGGTELFLFLTIEDVNDDGRRVDIVRDA
jgi:hypothetical protein